jgi:hypothetical protein
MPVINGVYLKDFPALPGAVEDANIIPIAITGNQVSFRSTVSGIVTDARVTSRLLTGLSVTGGAVVATDTILQAFGKVQNQINGKQETITLTTLGTSGEATLIGSTLNIPNYADGGVLSVGAIGASPNANAATITGTILNLEPASASFGGVVTTGTQAFAGFKTFGNSGSDNTVNIDHTSGAGIGLTITKGGNGEGLIVNKTGGTGNAVTVTGTLNATTLVKSGGTSSQFLKADGTVDSTAYGTGSVTSVGLTASTGISVSGSPITTSGSITVTNTAPDQTVVLTAGTGISTSGTYPNFTITNTSPSSGGTVTSVAALTLGTTGTDLSSSVANGTTTPVITLNVPTASASNRGALSAADWTTFNAKEPALTKGNLTEATSSVLTITGGTSAVIGSGTSIQVKQASGSQSGFLSSTDWTTFNNKTSNLGTVTSVGLSSATSGVTIGATPITTSGTITLAIATASGSQNGLLSSTDWTTFNGKQAALSGTGIVKSTAGVISYLTDPLPIANGGTGSATQNFVDLTTAQTIGGAKTLTSALSGTSATFSSTATATAFIPSGASVPTNGMYLSAANTLNFATNSTNRLTITSGGNVLIGTTDNAGFKLDVNGTGRFTSNLLAPKVQIGRVGTINDATGVDNTLQLTNYQLSVFVTGSADNYIYKSSSSFGGLIPHTLIFQTRSDVAGGGFAFVGGSTPSAIATISSTGAATFSSSVTASSFIKSGGTSSQFLKADGSVDSTAYGTASTFTLSGTGSTTSFNTGVVAETSITPLQYIIGNPILMPNSDAIAWTFSKVDMGGGTFNWYVMFETAPANGTNNIQFAYKLYS